MAPRERTQTQRKRPGGPAGAVKRRNCFFCKDKITDVDYKNITQLRRYISEKGKIRSRRITGACRRHQVQVAQAVKRADQFFVEIDLRVVVKPVGHALSTKRRLSLPILQLLVR